MKAKMLKNVYEGLNVKNVYEGLNARSEVYLSKVYFCEIYPTCVSSKLCEFIVSRFMFEFNTESWNEPGRCVECVFSLLGPALSSVWELSLKAGQFSTWWKEEISIFYPPNQKEDLVLSGHQLLTSQGGQPSKVLPAKGKTMFGVRQLKCLPSDQPN